MKSPGFAASHPSRPLRGREFRLGAARFAAAVAGRHWRRRLDASPLDRVLRRALVQSFNQFTGRWDLRLESRIALRADPQRFARPALQSGADSRSPSPGNSVGRLVERLLLRERVTRLASVTAAARSGRIAPNPAGPPLARVVLQTSAAGKAASASPAREPERAFDSRPPSQRTWWEAEKSGARAADAARSGRPPGPAIADIDVARLTDRVIRTIDHRIIAERERLGR